MSTQRSPILRVSNLGKRITLHILGGAVIEPFSGVSFDVDEGEFVAIVGPSGSGKSSVVKTIHRTYLATQGSALYCTAAGQDVDLASIPDRQVLELRRKEIGFVSQFLKVEPRVPAVDIVARPLMRAGVDETEARDRAAALLDRLDVPERLWQSYPALFSGGEQQRINIARALIGEPRLLLADEPTSALDATNTGRVVETLLEARNNGLTVIGVFHDIDLIERIADRVVVMGNGRVERSGPVGQIEIPRFALQQEFAPRV